MRSQRAESSDDRVGEKKERAVGDDGRWKHDEEVGDEGDDEGMLEEMKVRLKEIMLEIRLVIDIHEPKIDSSKIMSMKSSNIIQRDNFEQENYFEDEVVVTLSMM